MLRNEAPIRVAAKRADRVLRLVASVLMAVPLFVGPASATAGESDDKVSGGNGWEFSGMAYLWMANISGKQTAAGQEVDLDVSFGDIWDNLDFAAEAHVEGMKDKRWGFFVDGTYLKLGPEAKQGPVHIDIGYKYWLWELGGVYRANKWDTKDGLGALDLLLGGRYTKMDVDMDFQTLPLPNAGGSESWTDLIVGARFVTDLPHNWSLVLRGDLGGFGIGDSSDLSAQGLLVARWNFQPAWNLAVGYRALYQDYESGSGANKFAYDGTTHGPLLGVEYSF